MTDIPEDVMEAATRHYRQAIAEPVYDALPAIARAILEERERCAKIAANATIRSLVPDRNPRPIMGRTIIARAILAEDA